jgi:hypothetical protein
VRCSLMVRILAVAAMAWLLVLPATAAAYPIIGKCSLTLTSTDAAGNPLDIIKSGDESGSAGDPLLVDWQGTVSWEGQSQVSFKDNHYHVAMFGMATPFQGEASNSADRGDTAGMFDFSASVPFRLTGTFFMSAGIIAADGTVCSGSFVVRLMGDPSGTLPFFAGLALVAIGALLLARGFSGHLGAAIVGGLVLGFGAALEAVIFSVLPLAGLTPVALLATGIVLAAISAVVGGRHAGRLERALAAQVATDEAQGLAEAGTHLPDTDEA